MIRMNSRVWCDPVDQHRGADASARQFLTRVMRTAIIRMLLWPPFVSAVCT